jgi:hypothetical protein
MRKGHRERLKGGAEQDAFSGWRRVLCYMRKPGVVAGIKRQFNKRVRRISRAEIRQELVILPDKLEPH